jgi:hypothetical protein
MDNLKTKPNIEKLNKKSIETVLQRGGISGDA